MSAKTLIDFTEYDFQESTDILLNETIAIINGLNNSNINENDSPKEKKSENFNTFKQSDSIEFIRKHKDLNKTDTLLSSNSAKNKDITTIPVYVQNKELINDLNNTIVSKPQYWTQELVLNWLNEKNFNALIINKFKNFNGIELLNSFLVYSKAPEFFYKKLNNELAEKVNLADLAKLTNELETLFQI